MTTAENKEKDRRRPVATGCSSMLILLILLLMRWETMSQRTGFVLGIEIRNFAAAGRRRGKCWPVARTGGEPVSGPGE